MLLQSSTENSIRWMALAGSVHPVYYQFFPSLIQHWTRKLTHLLIPRVTMEVTTTHKTFYTLKDNEQLENKRKNCDDILLCHLNINSIQNNLEELVAMIRKLKAQIIFISETKIDSTYPDNQFTIPGYTLYRNDRKKGGGIPTFTLNISSSPQVQQHILQAVTSWQVF